MYEKISSAKNMIKMFKSDNELLERLKENPIAVLQETAPKAEEMSKPRYWSDLLLYRIAVIVLGSLALIAAVGSIVLVSNGEKTPEVLVSLGSAAVGALVGLFAPSPTGKQ